MTAMFTLVSLVKISVKGNKMAVKKLTSVYVSLQSGHEGVSGIAKGKFTVEDVASGSALVELNSDTSFTSANWLRIHPWLSPHAWQNTKSPTWANGSSRLTYLFMAVTSLGSVKRR